MNLDKKCRGPPPGTFHGGRAYDCYIKKGGSGYKITPGVEFATPCTQSSDVTVNRCTAPKAGQYVKEVCTPTSDTGIIYIYITYFIKVYNIYIIHIYTYKVLESCSTAIKSGSYVSSLCNPGTPGSIGSDMVVSQCSTEVPSSTFVTKFCYTGSTSSLGNDLQTAECKMINIAAGKAKVIPCVPGSSDTYGSDTTTTACTQPKKNQYVVTPCNGYSDSVIAEFTTPDVDPGISFFVDGYSGDAGQPGSDNSVKQCSQPSAGQYVSAVCSANGDTQFKSCAGQAGDIVGDVTFDLIDNVDHNGDDLYCYRDGRSHEADCRSSCASNDQCVAYNVDHWGCCYKHKGSPHPYTSGTEFYMKKSGTPEGSYVSSLCQSGSSSVLGSDLKGINILKY